MTNKDIYSILKNGQKSAGKITKPIAKESGLFKLHQKPTTTTIVDQHLKTTTSTTPVNSSTNGLRAFNSRWALEGSHLIRNVPEICTFQGRKDVKVAAFDLDGTLIHTKSGSSFARGPHDWKWWTPTPREKSRVVEKLMALIADDYLVVIFTNQGGVLADKSKKSYINFIERVNLIVNVLEQGNEKKSSEILVFASAKRPAGTSSKTSSKEIHETFRKPGTGMWKELENYLGDSSTINKAKSFYVGDAAGRGGDHSDSDLQFAKEVELEFRVPEDIFGDSAVS